MAYISQIVLPDGTTYDLKASIGSSLTLEEITLTNAGSQLGSVESYLSKDYFYVKSGSTLPAFEVDGRNNLNITANLPFKADGGISSTGFTASKILVSDANKNIVSGSLSESDLLTTSSIVAIANGGTGADSRNDAVKNLFNSSVGTAGTYVCTVADNWANTGITAISDFRKVFFANNTWVPVGDDVQIGDRNSGGSFCIQGLGGTYTNIKFFKKGDESKSAAFNYDGTKFLIDVPLSVGYKSGSFVNSLTNGAIIVPDATGSFGSWICGPTKNGRIAIATYQDANDILYIGYGKRGRTTNSYEHQMEWNGSTGALTVRGPLTQGSDDGISLNGRSSLFNFGASYMALLANNSVLCRRKDNANNYQAIYASAFNVASSRLVKENIESLDEDFAKKLLQLEIVSFDYIEKVGGDKNQTGMIAEDVLKILPEYVITPENYNEEETRQKLENDEFTMTLSIDYAKFVPPLIKLVQMQQKQINELKRRIEE